jgi:phosphoglycolate phosphatase
MKARMEAPDTLVFDLDGTLSDPALGIARSINHALVAFGFAPISESAVSQYIGPPLDQTFRAITGIEVENTLAALVGKYRERYADVGYAENVLYSGIPEALSSLAAQGRVLGVCTSKRVDFAEKILRMFGLRSHFAFVDGGEIGVHKDRQLRTLVANGTIGVGSTMIGDRAVDVLAAKRNALRSVGVLWGHGSHDELAQAGADMIVESVEKIRLLGGDIDG